MHTIWSRRASSRATRLEGSSRLSILLSFFWFHRDIPPPCPLNRTYRRVIIYSCIWCLLAQKSAHGCTGGCVFRETERARNFPTPPHLDTLLPTAPSCRRARGGTALNMAAAPTLGVARSAQYRLPTTARGELRGRAATRTPHSGCTIRQRRRSVAGAVVADLGGSRPNLFPDISRRGPVAGSTGRETSEETRKKLSQVRFALLRPPRCDFCSLTS